MQMRRTLRNFESQLKQQRWLDPERTRSKRQRKSEMRYDDFHNFDSDLIWAIVALIFGVAIASSLGCVSKSQPEPVWKPKVYLYSPDQARCVLVSGTGDKIDCDEPRMHDIGCVHLDELKALKFKLQRCERWK